MKPLDELLALLDDQIELLQRKLSLMGRVHDCVRHAEPSGLATLLREGSQLGAELAAAEERSVAVRRRVAKLTGLPADRVTLGRLVESLDGAAALAVNDRRERLAMVIRQLQDECGATARLARYALEFNNRLLAVLVGVEDQAGTYSAQGAVPLDCQGATFHEKV